ncbi:hypothetical protein ASZ90_010298 [hydrocarbon metagenome]|uniref:Uncharacterized protein n=1 Tax=hydrocarbon metagenome TaxID=938273 RepID=A0A0W8FGE9_9ZZZZ
MAAARCLMCFRALLPAFDACRRTERCNRRRLIYRDAD